MQALKISAVLALSTAVMWAAPPKPDTKPSSAAIDPAYHQSFEKWKAELVDNRKQNWLTLAGLFWLKPGENSFGSDPKNAIVFPKGPAHAGVFMLEGKDVTLKSALDAHTTVAGKEVLTLKLDPDTSTKPTVVDMGTLRFKVIVRGQRIGIRLKDSESPAVQAYRGAFFYPLNLSYRVVAKWVPSTNPKTIDVPNILGDIEPTPVPGEAVFTLNGKEYRLSALGGEATNGFFFVFNDLTSKTDTYPAGRFLDTEPAKDGTVVLDFNEAYNPPCSVTPYATCPLPPKENRLTVAVEAGEKYDRVHGHH
jgi:uncharacterized protein (DUF1684 family)